MELGKKSVGTSVENGLQVIKNLRTILTIIEHVKVLLELTAGKIWGVCGKSTLIFLVLIFRY